MSTGAADTFRLRSDIWVAAYIRRNHADGGYAALRKRGAAEAGAVFVLVDRLDGRCALYAPGPADETTGERRWVRAHSLEFVSAADIETRISREMGIDPDIWIVEIERRDGDPKLDLVELSDQR